MLGGRGREILDDKINYSCILWYEPHRALDHYVYKHSFLVALQPIEDYGLLIHDGFLDHEQRRTTVGRNPLDE